jgi:drug/metabolite transporter (DMT)-like permease
VARGGALLLVWPVSVLWLGEVVTPWAVAGALVLLGGLVVMGLSRPSGPVAVGVAWAAASAACIAGYHVAYKRALAEGAQAPALFTLSLGVALPMLLVIRRAHLAAVREQLLRRPGLVLATGVLCTLSFALMLVALASSGAGAVLTLRNTSIAFALGLSAMQGERLSRRQLSGAALVLGGAVLLGWPA